jgi:hypothetical protein
MPNLTKRTMPDRSEIDIADAKHVKYWTKALDVSKDDLFEAINKVGNAAATVRKELQRKGLAMPEDDKPLKPEDFPVNSEGKKIKKRMKRGVKKTSGRLNCRGSFHKRRTSRRLSLFLARWPGTRA